MIERSDHAIRCDVCGYSNGGTCNLRCACAPRRSPIVTAYDDRAMPSVEDYDALAAEVERLRELIKRWKALGKRHGIGLRDAECVCTWEFGDSKCPAHPTCDECGCVVCECAIDAAGVDGKAV